MQNHLTPTNASRKPTSPIPSHAQAVTTRPLRPISRLAYLEGAGPCPWIEVEEVVVRFPFVILSFHILSAMYNCFKTQCITFLGQWKSTEHHRVVSSSHVSPFSHKASRDDFLHVIGMRLAVSTKPIHIGKGTSPSRLLPPCHTTTTPFTCTQTILKKAEYEKNKIVLTSTESSQSGVTKPKPLDRQSIPDREM